LQDCYYVVTIDGLALPLVTHFHKDCADVSTIQGGKAMSHVTTKNGRKTLYVFYSAEKDDYDICIDKAIEKHNLQDTNINVICKPYKKQRSSKEKVKAIYRQLKDMKELCVSEGREPTHLECKIANEKLARAEELEAQL